MANEKMDTVADSIKRYSINSILIPEGILSSIQNNIHEQNNRDLGAIQARRRTLDALQLPSQQALAARTLTRRQTLERNAVGLNQGTGRHASSSRAPSAISLRGPQRENRSNSINLATLFRRQRRWNSQAYVSPSTDNEPLTEAVSDAPQERYFGRISIIAPDQIPHQDIRRSISIARPEPLHLHEGKSSLVASPWPDLDIQGDILEETINHVPIQTRRTTIQETHQRAQARQKSLHRSESCQILFQYSIYFLLLAFVYFILVGQPLWGGVVWYIYLLFEYHLTFVGGSAIFVGLAFFYAVGPLLVLFESSAPTLDATVDDLIQQEKMYFPPAPFVRCLESERSPKPTIDTPAPFKTALLIPCYKSAGLLPATLDAALKVFPASSIFILANGNNASPLDNTEEVCNEYGVNHIWIPIGSKIVAQYVGAYLARAFPFALLIDDDCILPPNFPIVANRISGKTRVIGYTLTSIGAERSRGTWCQQAQDLEYKMSGLQRVFAGRIGSATFPHGAIVLWETEFLIRTFKEHPGFSVSEDWFFGHVARLLGSRIVMCSSVFVETETPSALFFASGGSRGGFGEMTVFKQRFKRWNFFFVNGCYYNLAYILLSWKLGFWECGAKIFVFQEVYETALYLITPIVLPISFIVRPLYTTYLLAATLAMYLLVSVVFNEIHLRLASRKSSQNMMVNRVMLFCYYMPFKIALTAVNVASCWWSLWKYAKYFAQRHPRIVEDEKAVGIVLQIEENKFEPSDTRADTPSSEYSQTSVAREGRRLTATAIKVELASKSTRPELMTRDSASPASLNSTRGSFKDKSTERSSLVSQLRNWAPAWRENPTRISHDSRYPAPLNDIIEVEDEGEDTIGYSYYGV